MYILLYGSSRYETKNSVLTSLETKVNRAILLFCTLYAIMLHLFLKTCQAMVVLIILTPYRTPEISNTTYLLTVSSFIFLCSIDFKIIEISKHIYIEIKMIINHKPNNHNEVLTFLKTAKFNGTRRHNALQNKPHFHQNKSSQNFLLRSRQKRIKNLYAFLFL